MIVLPEEQAINPASGPVADTVTVISECAAAQSFIRPAIAQSIAQLVNGNQYALAVSVFSRHQASPSDARLYVG